MMYSKKVVSEALNTMKKFPFKDVEYLEVLVMTFKDILEQERKYEEMAKKEIKGSMKYRKKPVVIEAIKCVFENWNDICDFISVPNTLYVPEGEKTKEYPKLKIKTLEGIMTVNYGDWIIKGVKGEYYPCKPDIFKMTYEEVKND